MAEKSWRPPFWLMLPYLAGVVCIHLGACLYIAPDAPLIRGLPAAIKVPLLAAGAALLIAGSAAAVRLHLIHRHSR